MSWWILATVENHQYQPTRLKHHHDYLSRRLVARDNTLVWDLMSASSLSLAVPDCCDSVFRVMACVSIVGKTDDLTLHSERVCMCIW